MNYRDLLNAAFAAVKQTENNGELDEAITDNQPVQVEQKALPQELIKSGAEGSQKNAGAEDSLDDAAADKAVQIESKSKMVEKASGFIRRLTALACAAENDLDTERAVELRSVADVLTGLCEAVTEKLDYVQL